MTAFDTAWSLIKMPAKGWECPACNMPMMVEDTRKNHLECMNCGAHAMQPPRRARNLGYGDLDEMLDQHKANQVERQKQMVETQRKLGVNVVDKPKTLTEYEPGHQFRPLQMALNELGFESVQQLLQDYVKLKGATQNQDLRGMGLNEEADDLDRIWIEGILNRNNQFDSPFMRTKRGQKWDDGL
tara:strand:- start:131 stop:685 length:555 start_codon:yes stop_codon:yes gene_type:complete